jgi:hypothetical protein
MANVLLFEPGPAGEYAPGFPRTHLDAAALARAARLRGLSADEYAAQAVALRYSTGKPVFRLGTGASESVRAASKAEPDKPKVPLGERPAG